MSLRIQTVLAFGLVLLVILGVLFGIVAPTLSRAFARLEVTEVRSHVIRVVNAVSADLATLESIAGDWGAWDDTYEYIGGEMPSFYDDNMTPSSLEVLRLNLMQISDPGGAPIAFAGVDLENGEPIGPPGELSDPSTISALFSEVLDGETIRASGLLRLDEGILLVAAHQILTSQEEGPSRGVLIVGRFLDSTYVAQLAEQTHLTVTVRDPNASCVDPLVVDRLTGDPTVHEEIFIHPVSGASIAGHTLLRDVAGTGVGILSIETTRDTYQAGREAISYVGEASVGTLVVAMVVLLFLLDRRVLARMSVLSKGVGRIAAQSVPSGRVAVKGRDEIARLGHGMNEMLATLETSRRDLERSERQYRTLFEYSRDAIYITSLEGQFIDANAALVDLLGYPRDELMRRDAGSFYVDPTAREGFQQAIAQRGFVMDYPVQLKRQDGMLLDCLLTTVAQTDSDGQVASYQGIIRDVTEVKRQQAELSYLAMHDPLTGLLNRAALEDRLSLERARAERNLERLGVMYVDLDRFKEVNDTRGHAAGDQILRQVAERLVGALRASDSVARIGGDEFVILAPGLERPTDEIDIAEKVLEALREPFRAEGGTCSLAGSVGIAVFPDDDPTGEDLLQFADAAMYRAKQQGRDTWQRHQDGASRR